MRRIERTQTAAVGPDQEHPAIPIGIAGPEREPGVIATRTEPRPDRGIRQVEHPWRVPIERHQVDEPLPGVLGAAGDEGLRTVGRHIPGVDVHERATDTTDIRAVRIGDVDVTGLRRRLPEEDELVAAPGEHGREVALRAADEQAGRAVDGVADVDVAIDRVDDLAVARDAERRRGRRPRGRLEHDQPQDEQQQGGHDEHGSHRERGCPGALPDERRREPPFGEGPARSLLHAAGLRQDIEPVGRRGLEVELGQEGGEVAIGASLGRHASCPPATDSTSAGARSATATRRSTPRA